MKIALAGNPNSGKTTLFNKLTGSNQYVGNWPGVTVEKKEGLYTKDKSIIIQDLPGIYSLSPYSPEEIVSRNYLVVDRPDLIINIVDASNIERNLYLTTQLTEIGLPMIIALNMMDTVNKVGDKIDVEGLKKTFNIPIVTLSALRNDGIENLMTEALKASVTKQKINNVVYPTNVEECLDKIIAITNLEFSARYYAIKLFEGDMKAAIKLKVGGSELKQINDISKIVEEDLGLDGETIISTHRYDSINAIMKAYIKQVDRTQISVTDRIDSFVTNKWLGIPIFIVIMWFVYYVSIGTVGTIGTDWMNETLFGNIIPNALNSFFNAISLASWLQSLIVDGVVAGVGAVLGFLPQMIVLFFCLAILEDSGYMSRIAFIMDKVFGRFGLSGKNFIPLLIATGCSVPAIMASRTIESERERKISIITTSFMPCGAKLPIIALIAGSLFDGSAIIALLAYLLGIVSVIVSALILNKFSSFADDSSTFVMELPEYHAPLVSNILKSTFDRSKSFVYKAGTVIFVSAVILWFFQNFDLSFKMVEDVNTSVLANIGNAIAWIFIPLGFGNWESAVAVITGLIAKENVVQTFGQIYGFTQISDNGTEFWRTLANAYTPMSGMSFLIFNLLCAPCIAAIGSIRREMGNVKWTLIAIGYQTLFAYLIAFMVFQIWTFIVVGGNLLGFTLALIFVVLMIYLMFRKPARKAV